MRDLLLICGVAGFGGAGAVLRYLVSGWASQWSGAFPWGTLIVNVSGCLFLGALLEWDLRSERLPETYRVLLASGLLGAFTTYSTFGYETVASALAGEWRVAVTNVLANLLLGLMAVVAGVVFVRWLLAA